MKICMRTSIAGHAEPRYNLPEFSFSFGEIAEVDDVLGAAWVASGIAAPVVEETSQPTLKPKTRGK